MVLSRPRSGDVRTSIGARAAHGTWYVAVKVAFLIPRVLLAGGIFIVLEHASPPAREHRYDLTSVQTHGDAVEHRYPTLDHLELTTVDEAAGRAFDVAIATWWDTVYYLPRLDAGAYVHFVQSLEDRFYELHLTGA